MFQLLARIAADGKPRIKDDAKLLCLITLEKNNASNQDEKHNSKMWYYKEGKMVHFIFFWCVEYWTFLKGGSEWH